MLYCKGIEFLVVAATARQVPATLVRFVPNIHSNQSKDKKYVYRLLH